MQTISAPRPGHLHNGVDFVAAGGRPIHAADAGRVALVQSPGAAGGYGNFICLQHRPHLASCYAHLSAFAPGLRPGKRVKRGHVIGLVGTTGSSSEPHLHFEVRRGAAGCQSCAVDPLRCSTVRYRRRPCPNSPIAKPVGHAAADGNDARQ